MAVALRFLFLNYESTLIRDGDRCSFCLISFITGALLRPSMEQCSRKPLSLGGVASLRDM